MSEKQFRNTFDKVSSQPGLRGHNLLAALVDNHLHQGNACGLDLDNITWRRMLDVNDRALRNIMIRLGSREDGVKIGRASCRERV